MPKLPDSDMRYSLKSKIVFAAHKAQARLNNPFRGIPDDTESRGKLAGLPLPRRRYVIFFTPRSGSTRLTDILNRAGGLGSPDEMFNRLHMAKLAGTFGAQDLPDYLDLLLRKFTTGGTFGCEITLTQLYSTFFSEQRFFQLYQPTAEIFLLRENILEQAVSLSRMAQTGFSHSVPATRSNENPQEFTYAPSQIRDKLDRVLSMERQYEKMFTRRNLRPLRLSYEMLVNTDPEKFVPIISEHVDAVPKTIQGLVTVHEKINDSRSNEFAQRFASENVRLLRRVESLRTQSLEALAAQKRKLVA